MPEHLDPTIIMEKSVNLNWLQTNKFSHANFKNIQDDAGSAYWVICIPGYSNQRPCEPPHRYLLQQNCTKLKC